MWTAVGKNSVLTETLKTKISKSIVEKTLIFPVKVEILLKGNSGSTKQTSNEEHVLVRTNASKFVIEEEYIL